MSGTDEVKIIYNWKDKRNLIEVKYEFGSSEYNNLTQRIIEMGYRIVELYVDMNRKKYFVVEKT